ncbi:MAG: Hsp70 family protein [Tepidisphaeraceae bacterium]|jgi:hypothetical protein
MPQTLDSPSRYVVGIDLGTTNCSVAFVDTADSAWSVHDLLIPQLVAPATLDARATLPSFLYLPAQGEFSADALQLPWSANLQPTTGNFPIVGFFASEHGAAVPGRLVSSTKSWLCHSGVDRTAPLLPWHGAADITPLSPVEASAALLAHIRSAWDHAYPGHPLAREDLVLTVPASFDEVARELTVAAAKQAGLTRLTLVEEPQAAFYAWIASQGDDWDKHVHAGQKVLVCDIGGGTSDFTLIRVRPAESQRVLFHRVAVGQHLLLGGDNLDLAIAHHIEAKASPHARLPARSWGLLLRSARRLKETLLDTDAPHQLTVSVSAGGSKLIGGSTQVQISRDEILDLLLEGFLPRVTLEAKPATRRSGFQEFNLPYAPDPAITRYLAAFLSAHTDVEPNEDGNFPLHHHPARPDILLFNGGFFESARFRDRLLEVLGSWFSSDSSWRPTVLHNDRLDLAVSRGAAYYGMVRRGQGVRITGGLAHSYYIGVDRSTAYLKSEISDLKSQIPTLSTQHSVSSTGNSRLTIGNLVRKADPAPPPTALCLLPAGVEEGHSIEIRRTFNLLIRQPVEFPLYVSATRTADAPGALIGADTEQLTALPPIRTVLHSGRKSAADSVSVHLHARLTEIGTLELWAAETGGDRKWKLEFDVRSATHTEFDAHTGTAETQGFVDASLIDPARELIREAFSKNAAPPGTLPAPATPASLVKRLELLVGLSRTDWPASLMRALWEATCEFADARSLSPEHEARWLSFIGYCLRPGFGLAVDDWRVTQTWRIFSQRVLNPKSEQCRAEWWILWRRLAGGLSAGQQTTLAQPLIAALKSRLRPAGAISQLKTSPFQYGPAETAEVWRTLGSLELLKPDAHIELGDLILDLLPKEKSPAALSAALFALGRLGARVPIYAGLQSVLAPEIVEPWLTRLLSLAGSASADAATPTHPHSALGTQHSALHFAATLLARRTHDRYRDISDAARDQVLTHLESTNAPAHYIDLVRTGGQLEAEEQRLAFGETLPKGLRID